MEEWEYTFVTGTNLESELDRLGAQGWEAVGFAPLAYSPTDRVFDKYTNLTVVVTQWSSSQYAVLLKRRKP
jgi:hypothetical protein